MRRFKLVCKTFKVLFMSTLHVLWCTLVLMEACFGVMFVLIKWLVADFDYVFVCLMLIEVNRTRDSNNL